MKKHWQYLKYIARHKWFVFVAGLRTGAPIWNLLIHDWTKFLPSEWFPYVRQFYGGPHKPHAEKSNCEKTYHGDYAWKTSEEGVQLAFDIAWLHHQNRNKHHWQYWVLTRDTGETVALIRPIRFVREMVADWAGAGRAITGKWDVCGWYAKNKSRMILHSDTRLHVEQLLQDNFGPIPVIHSTTRIVNG